MRTLIAAVALAVWTLAGCGVDPGPTVDASSLDAGELVDAAAEELDAWRPRHDGGHDAGPTPVDAGEPDATVIADAGRDGGPDARAPWACSVVPQSGCASNQACRLAVVGGREPGNGPPVCATRGLLTARQHCEGEGDCQAGLFCWGVCHYYCDPAGAPCPSIEGSPFHCETGAPIDANPAGLGYCAWGAS